ncbi:hypothetical protein CAEBREN_14129 [Caenorhabditis brenneri]|uniref:Serpentine receptor class gamma n=1 Tax=Caenorhabditis brenneri TaxID=135651 RepID=G0PG73_CAEBE|nr:hypothetical protein CAEBREN_14129 [Caenorhabditis brenneri]
MSKIFNVLLTFSAISRFFLYFFPSTERFILSLQKKVISRIHIIYGLLFIEEAVLVVLRFKRLITKDEQFIATIDFVTTIDYTILNTILFLSGFLYIPIVISLKKYKNLPSAQQSNPQKYIMYQTMIMIIYRIPVMILIVINIAIEKEYKIIWVFFLMTDITDVFVTPFIIQVSYLSCNKRNMEVVFSIYTNRLITFFGRLSGRRIHPASDIELVVTSNM